MARTSNLRDGFLVKSLSQQAEILGRSDFQSETAAWKPPPKIRSKPLLDFNRP